VRSPGYEYGTEGGGLTALLEAMAMGKPIVVSGRPIFTEYVRDGASAVLVPPEDVTALARALNGLLADPDGAARLGRAARATVEERHTMPLFAARLAEVLGRVTRQAGVADARRKN
jgi:glycosyltransferase involved in cell wall biosynthesis